ncbi:MAG TPA: hypothetical protein VGM62_15845 [Chthoniobacterales bacterium]|jgi:hypothetical protein
MSRISSTTLLLAFIAVPAFGQFVPGLLQNRSYWGDGKSEMDFYDAEFVRDGEPHRCEVVAILTPLFVEPETLARVDTGRQSPAIPAIEMALTATVPRGLTVELRSIEALWRLDSMSLARLSFAGSDAFGNITKVLRENREANRVSWIYSGESYEGRIERQPMLPAEKAMVAYDELPLRVRMLDFTKPAGEFDIDLAPTLASRTKMFDPLKPAKLSWKTNDRAIQVELQHAAGKDRFVLDAGFPFLLREWAAYDGTHWKMTNSFKADPRKYLQNGDRERAWKDPMLRHPD